MEFLQLFLSAIVKTENIAITVLLVVSGFLAFLYISERNSNRLDRKELFELLNKNTEALNGVKIALEILRAKVE